MRKHKQRPFGLRRRNWAIGPLTWSGRAILRITRCSMVLVLIIGCTGEQPASRETARDAKADRLVGGTDGSGDISIPDAKSDSPGIQPQASIASAYPDDNGIEADPDVIFAEDFESGSLESLLERWSSTKNESGMSLASESPAASSGSRALQMTRLGGNDTGGNLSKRLGPIGEDHHDELYLRYYIKLDAAVMGSRDAPGGGLWRGLSCFPFC